MGLNAPTHGNRTYVNVVRGMFAKKVEATTPGAIERVIEKKDAKGKVESTKVVHELIFESVNGMIDSIEIDETGQFGDQLKINMSDVGDNFTVNLSLASREAKSFLCCLPNINLKAEILLKPFNFTSKEPPYKQVIGLNTYQGGKTKEFKVPAYFSKENPNGLPPVPEESDKDEFKIVMKQQEIFLKKYAKKFIAEHFAKPVTAVADQDVKPVEAQSYEPSDDLPF